MRTSLFACLIMFACGGGGGTSDNMMGDDEPPRPDGGPLDPPARGFQLVSPPVTIGAGDEISYCYYFRTPNTEPLAIKRWASVMSPGSHHLIMFTTGSTDRMPPGTVSASNCGFSGSSANAAHWVYAAETATNELALPTNDGAGKPVALVIPPNTAGYIQMHFVNPTSAPIQAQVTINAEALAANVAFTPTAPYITYNAELMVMPGVVDVETQSCDVPAGAKFWSVTTHSHKHAMKAEVLDGTSVIFSTTNWDHPGSQT
ncbi:MAG TPA: hypothetical protein VK427_18085, partial [Kofleriaceae bacterium]|nr:hypothetical protein [Kofleriaceae bacterium]